MRTRILIIDGRSEPDALAITSTRHLGEVLDGIGADVAAWRASANPIADTSSTAVYAAASSSANEHPARNLMRMVRRTDGIFVAGSERHGVIEGMLKVALDTLSPAEIDAKPVGFLIRSDHGYARVAETSLRLALKLLTATIIAQPVVLERESNTSSESIDIALVRHGTALFEAASRSRAGRQDRDGYQTSPILGASHEQVRPLRAQPDSFLARDLLEQRYRWPIA